MSSTFAQIVLGLSIPLMIGVFFVMPPLPACLVVALGGEMFLPVGVTFRFPSTPPFGKHNLVYLCILVGCLLRCPARVTRLPKEKWFVACSLLALVGGAITGLTNPEVLIFGATGDVVIPAMTFRDGMFVGINEFFPSCLAFYLGYMLFRGTRDVERLLAGLGIAGLVYCPFAIVEMRMSPQFHQWIYGYNIGAFDQAIRWGGYRPSVFMAHGLALARFFMATTLALFVLAKSRRRLLGLPVSYLAWFNAIILVLCRSTGAVVLALAGGALILLAKPKRQLLVASVLAIAVLAYPWLRASGLFPVSDILNAAGALDADRSQSLAFRFGNEDRLLARACERLFFGWGTYGRSFIYDTDGKVISITDGEWIIVLGISGIAGFIVSFGVLLWPVVWTRRRLRKCRNDVNLSHLAGLALILALVTVDLIPNGLWSYYPFLLAGVLTRGVRDWKPLEDFDDRQSSEDNGLSSSVESRPMEGASRHPQRGHS
jgi:hypothetical protein